MPKKGIIFITGGAKNLGKLMVLSLIESGYDIALHYHQSQKEAEELARQHDNITLFRGDLRDEHVCQNLLTEVYESCGPVLGLIHNASSIKSDTLKNLTFSSMHYHMQIHLYAPLILSKAFAALPYGDNLPKRHIISMLDFAVNTPASHSFASYAISKSALHQAMVAQALEFAPSIHVNAIAPGPCVRHAKHDAERFAKAHADNPLAYGVVAEDICRTLRFLLEQPSMTGQTLFVDGGKHLGGYHYY